MRRILVIALAGIGDTLLVTPLIHELRQQLPKAEVDVLVMWPGARDLLETNPHISKLHFQHLISAGAVANVRFLRGLGRNQYEVIINSYPQSRIHYRVVARLINAPVRMSHVYDNVSVFDRLLVNRTLPQDYTIHVIENNLNLLRLIDLKPVLVEHDTEIYFSDAELKWAESQAGAGEKIREFTWARGRRRTCVSNDGRSRIM
jgi:ADP-heptose:LPS heptosyltransferase